MTHIFLFLYIWFILEGFAFNNPNYLALLSLYLSLYFFLTVKRFCTKDAYIHTKNKLKKGSDSVETVKRMKSLQIETKH